MINKLLKLKSNQDTSKDAQAFLSRNVRFIERGLRQNCGYSRVDALAICRDLREALKGVETR